MIRDYRGRKSVMVTAHHAGMAHSTTAVVWKNKRKIMKGVKGSALSKAMRPVNIWEAPMSDMERLLMAWIRDRHRGVSLSAP